MKQQKKYFLKQTFQRKIRKKGGIEKKIAKALDKIQ